MAPHLHPLVGHDDFGSFRGAADGLALRLRVSDARRHAALAPAEPVRRMLFDAVEQFRVESLAPAAWPGVRHNLEHRFERWTTAWLASRLHETSRGLYLFAVLQTLRARVFGQPVPEEIDELVEGTRFRLAPVLGPELAALRKLRHDQTAFARAARVIVEHVVAELEADGALLPAPAAGDEAQPERDERLSFGLMIELPDGGDGDALPVVAPGVSRVLQGASDGYRVWSTAWDLELRPAAGLRDDELDAYRARLDGRIAALGLNPGRLARQLRALFAAPADDDWAGGLEEGLIDGRRLAQLVASPTERRLFRQERREPACDAVVGFLLDCSGSMRVHIEAVAVIVDVAARALESAGVACEVLGFSTGAWNGGRAARDWRRAGSPPHPGRVAELNHLIFKDADTRWRTARRAIAAMLRPDRFREGVDGEALQWAAARLAARPESRKLLVVVSDGCPMETATTLANDPHYLDHHLQQVAAAIESDAVVELAALGVGLDLSPYYGRCQALDLDAGLDHRVFDEWVTLVARPRQR